jgi:Arc/MetJ-type ribon-helix-helix transcriptional regulator
MSYDQKYIAVSIPSDLIRRIDRLVEEGDQGYESRAEAVRTAVRKFLEQEETRPRLEQLESTEEQTLLRDNLLNQTVRVYRDDRGLFCELCESSDCVHTRYAKALKTSGKW